jgi:hypothetical protein
MSETQVPAYLTADSASDWHYYVPDRGSVDDAVGAFGEPDEFEYERLWMRPIRASALDESERDDDVETVTRDARGRFAPVIFWIECGEQAPGAVAFYGLRYK